jgi:hypothetical protein
VLDTPVAEYNDEGQHFVDDEVDGTADDWNCVADDSPFNRFEHKAFKYWPHMYDSQLSALQTMEGAWTINDTKSRIWTLAVRVDEYIIVMPPTSNIKTNKKEGSRVERGVGEKMEG